MLESNLTLSVHNNSWGLPFMVGLVCSTTPSSAGDSYEEVGPKGPRGNACLMVYNLSPAHFITLFVRFYSVYLLIWFYSSAGFGGGWN